MNCIDEKDRPWLSLEDAGTQSFGYPEILRTDVYPLIATDPKRILDIGCASGAVGAGLKSKFPGVYVIGCELDELAAKKAEQRLDQVITTPLRKWDSNQLEHLKTIDTVMLLDVLEHMYNPWEELVFLSQHLQKSAQVIVSLPNIKHISTFDQLHKGYWRYEYHGIRDITHLRFFTEYEMERLFYQAGFRVEKKLYLGVPVDLQFFEQYPVNVDLNNGLKMQIRSEQHWIQLFAFQIGFCIRIAEDAQLSPQELVLRYGKHASLSE